MTTGDPYRPEATREGSGGGAFGDWLVGRSATNLGSAVTTAVLPLVAVVTLRATPSAVALLVAAPMATAPIGRLAASSHAERSHGRIGPLMMVDVARLVVLATIPATFALGVLSVPVLVAQAALLGALVGIFGAYGAPFVVSVVADADLARANGALASSSSAAAVLGPGVAAGLLEVVQAPLALLVEIVSYFVAIPSLVRIRQRQGRTAASSLLPRSPAAGGGNDREPAGSATRAALAAPFTHPGTRGRLAVLFAGTVLNGMVLAELAVFMVRDLRIAPSLVAAVGALGALGGVGAGIAVGRLSGRLGERRSLAVALIAMAASTVPLPLAARGLVGLGPCLGYELFGSAGGTIFIVLTFTAIQQRLPRHQLARAMAASALVPELGQLLGVGLAGVAVSAIGVLDLLRVAAIIGLVLTTLAGVDLARTHRPQ
ncbi:MAG: MFS transporter [Acidimicrobiales bacterium]